MIKQKTAIAIINQAKENGFYDDPLPEGAEDQLAEALTILDEAKHAYDKGARGDAIVSILGLAQVDDEVNTAKEPEPKEKLEQTVAVAREVLAQSNKGISFHTQVEAKELAIAKIKKEKLPIPPEIEGEPPALPRDISVLTDPELRRLHSEFNAVLARANWLVALVEADELAAEQIASLYEAQAIKRAAQDPDPVTGKGKTVAALEAEASDDELVRKWREKKTEYVIDKKLQKALRDTYLSNVERISREYAMREGERK
jgi:hypothetical protein